MKRMRGTDRERENYLQLRVRTTSLLVFIALRSETAKSFVNASYVLSYYVRLCALVVLEFIVNSMGHGHSVHQIPPYIKR